MHTVSLCAARPVKLCVNTPFDIWQVLVFRDEVAELSDVLSSPVKDKSAMKLSAK